MEDTTDPVQPTEPTPAVTPAGQTPLSGALANEPAAHEPVASETPVQPTEPAPTPESAPTEESFLRKNKMLIIGGIVALIVITVAVGILLSLKNSEKLEGLIKLRDQQTTQETHKIPRK